jgi:hypothetical protein
MNQRPAVDAKGWCIVAETIQTDLVVAGMPVKGWSPTGAIALFLDGEVTGIETYLFHAYAELGVNRGMVERWLANVRLVPKDRVLSWPRKASE